MLNIIKKFPLKSVRFGGNYFYSRLVLQFMNILI